MGQRSFQKRAQYQEGRKVRGSRQARAMSKSTRFVRVPAMTDSWSSDGGHHRSEATQAG
jgi:RIO kinase 1